MNLPLYISQRLNKGLATEKPFAKSINRIAIIAIALGLGVMILSVAILIGFKQEIREKIVGFGGNIQIVNFDSNYSYETAPISSEQPFLANIAQLPEVKHIQTFATKAGIISANDEIVGVVLKGVGADFNWDYFNDNIIEGSNFVVADSLHTNQVVISKKISDMLQIGVGDQFSCYFIQEPPRVRRFDIVGIYETSLEEFDEIYLFCDIYHIQRLNGWSDNQVGGFEIYINHFDNLDEATLDVRDIIRANITSESNGYRISNIKMRYPQIFDWLNFQDLNVVIIIILMLIVAGFNMISGLLILILEKTNMIGVLKALGANDNLIRKTFLYQAGYLICKGLFWGNIIGIGLAIIQKTTEFVALDPSSYYLKTVPIHLNIIHILLLNVGTMAVIIAMLLIPSKLISRISPIKAIRFD